MGIFWKIQPKIWLTGGISQVNLYTTCAIVLGGGTLLSVIGAEVATNKVSETAEKGFNKFTSWFSSNKTNLNKANKSQDSLWSNFQKIEQFSSKYFGVTKEFLKNNLQKLSSEKESLLKLLKEGIKKGGDSQDDLEWRNFLNGLWTLMGFAYRDEMKIEKWTFIYLLANLFIDIEEWNWKDLKNSLSNTYKNLNGRVNVGVKNLLFLLLQLNQNAKEIRELNEKNSSRGNQKRTITINRDGIKWTMHNWKWTEENPPKNKAQK